MYVVAAVMMIAVVEVMRWVVVEVVVMMMRGTLRRRLRAYRKDRHCRAS